MSDRSEYIDLRKSSRISITEGIFAQIFGTLGGPGSVFLTKFAVFLGATPFHFGVLGAIGQLSQIFQPIGVIQIRKRSERKRITLGLLSFGRLTVVLFGIMPLLFPSSIAIWIFLALFMVSSSFNAIGTNTWITWISDLIPLRIRGRFLSKRTQFLMVAGIVTGYVFGAFVDIFDSTPGKLSALLKRNMGIAEILPENSIRIALITVIRYLGICRVGEYSHSAKTAREAERAGIREYPRIASISDQGREFQASRLLRPLVDGRDRYRRAFLATFHDRPSEDVRRADSGLRYDKRRRRDFDASIMGLVHR